MYAYVNAKDCRLVALMPSTRGRPPANHAEPDSMTSISVTAVPAAAVEHLPTAVAVKQYVVKNGGGEWENPTPDSMLLELLHAFHNVLHGSGQVDLANQCDAVRTSFDAESGTAETWVQTAVDFLARTRRIVNREMVAAEQGWRQGVEFARTDSPESATGKDGAAVTSYGFEKLSEKSKFSVLSESERVEGANGVFYPKADPTYIISRQIENLFTILEAASKKCPQNVSLVGPHGCGKTELAIQFAAKTKRPMLIMDCANLREARDWFGYKTARDGTVYWNESQFVRAVQAGNHVVLLDELNRANSSLLNTLMPILDARRFTYLEEKGDNIIVGPGTVFFATMNEGAGYTGTSALDRAIRDRFPRAVELSYLSEKEEAKLLVNRTGIEKDIATRLVQMANKIRNDANGISATLTESVSTRQLIAAAHDYVLGGVETLEFTITNHFSADGDDESERVKVQSIIQGKFGDIIAAKAAAGA